MCELGNCSSRTRTIFITIVNIFKKIFHKFNSFNSSNKSTSFFELIAVDSSFSPSVGCYFFLIQQNNVELFQFKLFAILSYDFFLSSSFSLLIRFSIFWEKKFQKKKLYSNDYTFLLFVKINFFASFFYLIQKSKINLSY